MSSMLASGAATVLGGVPFCKELDAAVVAMIRRLSP